MLISTSIQDVVHGAIKNIIIESQIEGISTDLQYPIKPTVKIDDTPFSNQDQEYLLDRLGYFNSADPSCVFLCEQKIIQYASSINVSPEIIALIVYIHESAHYFHFHLRNIFVDDFNSLSKMFLESFSQLITHKICIQLNGSFPILNTYLDLIISQPIQYRQYKQGLYESEVIGVNANEQKLVREVHFTEKRIMHLYSSHAIMNTFIKEDNDDFKGDKVIAIINSLESFTKRVAEKIGLVDNDAITLEMLDLWDSQENFYYNKKDYSFL
jgi:hypothetical protein